MRVVGKPEAFFGNPDQVAIEFRIAIFIMDGRNAIITRLQVLPHHGCLAPAWRDGSRSVSIRFVEVLRPPVRRREKNGPNDSVGISETIDMNTQRTAAGGVGGGTIPGRPVRRWSPAGKRQDDRRDGRDCSAHVHKLLTPWNRAR